MHKIFMLYYPLLDPVMKNPDVVLEIYEQYGCSIIEISLPCENPELDGPVIRDSMRRILEHSTVEDVFEAAGNVKKQFPSFKIQIVAYMETVEKLGAETLADLCGQSHVDYLLLPDASDSQLEQLDQVFASQCDIPLIRFLPYTSCEEMLERARYAEGYLFMQSGAARSGGCQEIGEELKNRITYLRKNGIGLPIIIGFGIQRGDQIKACLQCGADGVTIGSRLVNDIAKSEIDQYLASLMDETWDIERETR